jgi:hypothetical protein
MRRYRGGRQVRVCLFAFPRKFLLRFMSEGWNDFGYILDGSSMMFSEVQSLMAMFSRQHVINGGQVTDAQHGSDA